MRDQSWLLVGRNITAIRINSLNFQIYAQKIKSYILVMHKCITCCFSHFLQFWKLKSMNRMLLSFLKKRKAQLLGFFGYHSKKIPRNRRKVQNSRIYITQAFCSCKTIFSQKIRPYGIKMPILLLITIIDNKMPYKLPSIIDVSKNKQEGV